jgi:hypothetical protein
MIVISQYLDDAVVIVVVLCTNLCRNVEKFMTLTLPWAHIYKCVLLYNKNAVNVYLQNKRTKHTT